MKEKIALLNSLLSKLLAKDLSFAESLIAAYKKYGSLTPNQAPWVDKLIFRAQNTITVQQKAEKIEASEVDVGDFSGVISLFQTAKQYLKYPKIVLSCLNKPVILSVAGPASKFAGWVQVAGEGQYPNREYYGKVSPDGKWVPHTMTPEMKEALTFLLTAFSSDPARVAQKHGVLTGSCCFCNSTLTDKRSTAAGFGPVCAKHYGLQSQWENAVKKAQLAEGKAELAESKEKLSCYSNDMIPLNEGIGTSNPTFAEEVAEEVAKVAKFEKQLAVAQAQIKTKPLSFFTTLGKQVEVQKCQVCGGEAQDYLQEVWLCNNCKLVLA